VTIDPAIVSGVPVFKGTRVPVEALLTNLEAGLDEFLQKFPTVANRRFRSLSFPKTSS
jgi:uncharacterized protein (DUF433 family)